MTSFKGKRVLITGGAGGIGLCTAQEFLRAGGEVIITDIDAAALESAVRRLAAHGGPVHTRRVDVTDEAQVKALARWVLDEIGGLDVLINNAGIGYSGELAETTPETWRKLLAVNLLGPLYHIHAFLPHFQERRAGHIVNVSSGQAYFRMPTWGAYASVKAALGVFSEILHFELRKYRVKVTTVYPYMVNTRFYKDIQGDTWGARLSMKLVPYYSMTPERVARIIFRAVKRGVKVERVSLINDLGRCAQVIPLASDLMALTSNYFLGKRAKIRA